jgi:signal recognition particle receptor subunit alpha
MRWRILNEAGLIFVVAYQEQYNVLYSDKLLDFVVQDFTVNELPNLKKIGKIYIDNPSYTESFMKLLRKWEGYCQGQLETSKTSPADYKKKKSEITHSGSKVPVDKKEEHNPVIEEIRNDSSPMKENGGNSNITGSASNSSRYSNIPKKSLLSRQSAPKSNKSEGKSAPIKKQGRVWDGEFQEVNKENLNKYDHSTTKPHEVEFESAKKSAFEGPADPDNLNDDSFDEEEEVNTSKKTGLFSRLTSSLKNYIGNKVLTEEDLETTMKEFTSLLMEKNVAKEIAENLCSSVSKSLLNTKTQSFTSIAATVKEALKESIAKILTPKQEFDVLKQALAARKRASLIKLSLLESMVSENLQTWRR